MALVLQLSLIMFKTGSMSPGIPAGSLALVREIPAAEARVGDVVTVERPGQLPVTHRVVSSTAGPGSLTTLVLKGDANAAVDPAPYRVASVRVVVWSTPGLARVVVWLGDPRVLGAVTLGVASLVTWAFWPRSGPARHRLAARGGSA
jgi:signal peptidase